jgi:hypothetical protein
LNDGVAVTIWREAQTPMRSAQRLGGSNLRNTFLLTISLSLLTMPALAGPGDFDTCLDAGDKAKVQGPLGEEEKRAAHEACQRALSDSSSVVMKYHLQEADFDIMGRPPR